MHELLDAKNQTLQSYAERFNLQTLVEIDGRVGDSVTLLNEALSELNTPALFWLDGNCAADSLEIPIYAELLAVFSHHVKNHVILINGARRFGREANCPTVDEFLGWITVRRRDLGVIIRDDIIHLVPPHCLT